MPQFIEMRSNERRDDLHFRDTMSVPDEINASSMRKAMWEKAQELCDNSHIAPIPHRSEEVKAFSVLGSDAINHNVLVMQGGRSVLHCRF